MSNKKLEKMLDEMQATENGSPTEEMMQLLRESMVVTPTLLPRDTSPEIMRQLVQNPGLEQQIPAGINPRPCVLQNEQGEKVLAVFTSEKQLRKDKSAQRFPITMRVPFDSCVQLVRRSGEMVGIAVNPFTHNAVFRVEENKPQPKAVQVTIEQFHILTRKKMESIYLPKTLFEKKGTAVEKLRDGQGTYLRELYEDLYDTEVACPYVPEDFEIMSLKISEELLLIRITMPGKYMADKTCPCIMVGWNESEHKVWYYAIVLEEGKNASLYELKDGGGAKNLGQAPSEGSELTTIIDLIQNENA